VLGYFHLVRFADAANSAFLGKAVSVRSSTVREGKLAMLPLLTRGLLTRTG